MEIKLWMGDYGSWRSKAGTGMICGRGLNAAVDLKDRNKIKNLFVVFSKSNKGDHDYFTIEPGRVNPRRGFIVETRVQLLWGAYQALGRAYNKGYHFLHFEVTYKETT